jgi:GR25 family glycosyltransferase involved in LPS biosynthesis
MKKYNNFKYFDSIHIYIINMEKKESRMKLMKYRMNKIGLDNYSFFKAIDGNDSRYRVIYNALHTKHNNMSKGSFGLILTYIYLLRDAHINNYEKILIFEDDVSFHKKFSTLIKKHESLINGCEYDIVWFGANQRCFTEIQLSSIKNISAYKPNGEIYTYGTFGILIRKNGIRKMIKTINLHNLSKLKPIDNMLNIMIACNKLNGIVLFPFLVVPDVTESDNIGPRNQVSFCSRRKFDMVDYDFVSLLQINKLIQFMDKCNVNTEKLKKICNDDINYDNQELQYIFNETVCYMSDKNELYQIINDIINR